MEVLKNTFDDFYGINENKKDNNGSFVIDNLNSADWALRKVKQNNDTAEERIRYAEEEIKRLKDFIKDEEKTRDRKNEFLVNELKNYLEERRREDPKFKLKTVTATVSTRKNSSWKYDDDKLINFFKNNDMKNYIRVKEEVDKKEFKKNAIVTDSGAVVTENGEVIEGVEVSSTDTISIRFN